MAGMPYEHYHKAIVIHLIFFTILWLNAFPQENGISMILSPREIVTQRRVDFKKHCQTEFGAYVEAHDDPEITNTTTERTREAIALGPTGNIQGTQKVFCLKTGLVLKRRKIIPLPVPDRVIKKVNQWGVRSKREEYGKKLKFLNRNRQKYDWDNDELNDEEGLVEPEPTHPELTAEMPGIEIESEQIEPSDAVVEEEYSESELAAAAAENAEIEIGGNPTNIIDETENVPEASDVIEGEDVFYDDDEVPDEGVHDAGVPAGGVPEAGVPDAEVPSESISHHEARAEPPEMIDPDSSDDEDSDDEDEGDERRYPRRNRNKPKTYVPSMTGKKYDEGYIHLNIQDEKLTPMSESEKKEHVLGVIMLQQFNLNAGLKKFGSRGEAAVSKELKQLHDMRTFFPVEAKSLSKEERLKALSSLMFLTEKRDGKIKGRACADGRKQREEIKREDAASPTVALDSILLTSAIDAHEGREVATIDIPGAYLHTDTDEEIVMLLRGKLAELMAQVDPKLYRKYITKDSKGRPILYVRMQKALYGLLRSALLFYLKLVKDLEAYGFTLNPYDPCVANAMINGSQMTVTWHVDDLKVSHAESFQITKFATYLSTIYGKKLTVHRGKIHDYLGMDLDFTNKGVVKVAMIKYLKKIISDFPELINTKAATPAADHLFNVRDDEEAKYLPEEQAIAFHHTVAQLLFLSARARRDIQTPVSFLTTRVKKPDEDDWGKLK